MWNIINKLLKKPKNNTSKTNENNNETKTSIEISEKYNEETFNVDINQLITYFKENEELNSFEKETILNIINEIKNEVVMNNE